MLTVTLHDHRNAENPVITQHQVYVTSESPTGFDFKAAEFPLPSPWRNFFVGGREILVQDLHRLVVEDRVALFFFSATFA